MALCSMSWSCSSVSSAFDLRRWRWDQGGRFTVSKFHGHLGVNSGISFPTRFVWSKFIPPRISFFIWVAMHNSILTMENLKRRRWKFANRCYLCKHEEETVDHLLIHCEFTYFIWNTFLIKFGTGFVFPRSVVDLVHGWGVRGRRRRSKLLWSLIPAAVMWNVWAEHNGRAFRSVENSREQVNVNVISSMHSWSSFSGEMRGVSLGDLIENWDNFVLDPG